MGLILNNRTNIFDVKKHFSHLLSFLKLEFYPNRHQKEASSVFEEAISDGTPLSEVPSLKDAVFPFTPFTTIAEFEQRLKDDYRCRCSARRVIFGWKLYKPTTVIGKAERNG